MPYPISINKDITITLDNSIGYTDILNGVTEDLIESGNEIEIRDNKIKIVTCSEFCSRTSFKDFNKGQVELSKSEDKVKINFKIYLTEHLIIFLGIIILGTYGLFNEGPDSILVRISLLLLIIDFVFCYLMPLMTLDSFVKNLNRTLKK